MKSIFIFLICLFFSKIIAQNPEWINLTNGEKVFRIVDTGDVLWIGTDGGLVSLNKTTNSLKYFNRANVGLPGNHIYSLAIDNKGKVWVGDRDYGIGVFDGEKCFVFNTNNSDLPFNQWNTAISIDNQNRKWIGSLFYLSIFDGQNWKIYRVGDILSSFTIINDIKFDSKGNAWIGGTWGLSKFEGDKLIEKYQGFDKEIKAIYVDRNDCLWLATNRAGLVKLFRDIFVYYDTTNSGIPSNTVYDVKGDSKGNIWLATVKGLVKYNGSKWNIFNNENSQLPDDIFFSIEIDKNDENIIWIGTWKHGLIKFDGQSCKIYKMSNSILPSNNINDIEVDKKSKLWLGTTEGLVSYDGLNWEIFNKKNSDLKNNFITSLFVDNNNSLWIGARDSFCLTKYDGHSWHVFDSTNSIFTREWVRDINMDKKGNLWISTLASGLIKYSFGKWTRYTTFNSNLTSNCLDFIAIDDFDNVWVSLVHNPFTGGKGGLAKYNGNDFIIYNNENSDIPYENVFSPVFDSESDLWFISSKTNLSINLESALVKFDGKNFFTFSKPKNSSLSIIYIDGYNNLWIGGVGLFRFDRYNEWKHYNVLNSGLSENGIQTICIDSNQNVWIGHLNSGISVFRKNGIIFDTTQKFFQIPQSIKLLQNYPNPFNNNTSIEYEINELDVVKLEIYNDIGQRIKTLVNKIQYPGHYKVNWDGKDLNGKICSSGIYLYVLKVNEKFKIRKMILLK